VPIRYRVILFHPVGIGRIIARYRRVSVAEVETRLQSCSSAASAAVVHRLCSTNSYGNPFRRSAGMTLVVEIDHFLPLPSHNHRTLPTT
jgi:hypothetical protein